MFGFCHPLTSQVALVVKNPPANAGDLRDEALVPRLGRSPGKGHGNPLQYSCLGNPMDRGVWQAIVHGVTKSQTRLKRFSTTHMHTSSSSQGKLQQKDHGRRDTRPLRLKPHFSDLAPSPMSGHHALIGPACPVITCGRQMKGRLPGVALGSPHFKRSL